MLWKTLLCVGEFLLQRRHFFSIGGEGSFNYIVFLLTVRVKNVAVLYDTKVLILTNQTNEIESYL